MNNHAGTNLTRPTETTFSQKTLDKVALGEGCLGYPGPYSWGLRLILEISRSQKHASIFMNSEHLDIPTLFIN